MNNKEMYKKCFSQLHASEIRNMEAEEMKSIKSKIRISKRTIVCFVLLATAAAVPCLSFAATDGQTANPITAVKICINGQELNVDEVTKNSDGSYSMKIEPGDNMTVEQNDGDPENTKKTEVSVKVPEDSADYTATVTIPPDGNYEVQTEIEDAEADAETDSSTGAGVK